MKLKHNWGLLKNQAVGFKQIEGKEATFHKGILNNVKTSKDSIQFIFTDGKMLDISTAIFNRLYIRNENEIIWFIYENQGCEIISGLIGFTMSDTYGFPIEITEEMLAEDGFKLDIDGFNVMKDLQKEKSKNSFKNKSAF